jgi:hypothetical protein
MLGGSTTYAAQAIEAITYQSICESACISGQDSNSEMSLQIIALKGRTDSRGSTRILVPETIRV